MSTYQEETEPECIERAVDLLDQLLRTADGGYGITLGQYGATTILALLMDRSYRLEVMSRLDDFACVDSEA
jgi:hypothetical protein